MKNTLSAVAFATLALAPSGSYAQCVANGRSGLTTTGATVIDQTAQAGAYAQCGGKGWSGTTACVDGFACTFSNDWYSQCLPETASHPSSSKPASSAPALSSSKPSSTAPARTTLLTSVKPSATPSAVPSSGASVPAGKLKWLGVDESSAEFGTGNYPGIWGTHFIFPDTNVIGSLIKEGYNIFRIPFAMERLVAPSVSGSLQTAYLENLTDVVDFITKQGKQAILDPHNFGRYNGNIITDTNAFKTFWTNVAGAFRSNANVIFDTNNEYHDMDQDLVLKLNQAAIDGIRAAGATTQYILAEGNSYSGAWTWTKVNDNLKALVDPQNKLIYQMHQYLDSDGSGTSATCVSSTIGKERLVDATQWLRDNKKIGILGEFAGGANDQCKAAVTGLLDHLQANSDVWMGALWWAGGPWWHNYIYSFEPPNGVGYQYYDALLKKYAP